MMLVRALLQTSLVLWLAQQTLQGGVKPQSVSWGRVLPARGVGVGVKPGVAGALGAVGSRYGSKAMKTGIGRYPGTPLGVGGYRSLGLGGRAGLKPGGYGTQGAYGASLGTGMGLGTGLTNGLGLGLGQAGRRAYGAGLGNLPGYGGLAGIGYPGARPGLGLGYPTGQRAEEQIPGVSAADLGGPELAALGRAAEELKKEKSRDAASFSEKRDMTLGPETPAGREGVLGPTASELHTALGVKILDPLITSSGVRSTTPLEKQRKMYGLASQAHGGAIHNPMLLKRKSTTLAAGGVRQQLPPNTDNPRNPISASSLASVQQNQRIPNIPNCASNRDLSDNSKIYHRELLGSDRTQALVPQRHLGKEGKNLGPATPQGQRERTYPRHLPQTEDIRGNTASLPRGQGNGDYLSAAADRQGVRDLGLVAKDRTRLIIHGAVTVENPAHSSQSLPRRESYGLVVPRASETQSLGLGSVAGPEAAEGREADRLHHAERGGKEPKAHGIPEQTVRNNQATRFIGGAGNYLGASLGPGAYGTGLGQGGYLGGAAGKLGALGHSAYPQGVPGKSTGEGYGDGATGYLGAVAGNGYGGDAAKALAAGYGNGYSDGYGAGLGYPAELADVAERKAGKNKALSTGSYAGQVQGAYEALGAGLESTGGKYGGAAAQVPYGNAPVIPTGLEGEGGYPYAAQPLSLTAGGVKTSSKYGAGARFGAQQAGYGAQLGVTQDALGEEAGKYAGVNGALGNEYKG